MKMEFSIKILTLLFLALHAAAQGGADKVLAKQKSPKLGQARGNLQKKVQEPVNPDGQRRIQNPPRQDAGNAVPVLGQNKQLEGMNPKFHNVQNVKKEFQKLTGLAASEECRDDIDRLCEDKTRGKKSPSNLELLSCLTNRLPTDEDLDPECHHFLWQYKLNITKDEKFDNVARDICKDAVSSIGDCQKFGPDSGKLIPCLLEHKDKITERPCYHFLVKMGTIIFSDYRLICDFVDECGNDINTYHCGNVDSSTKEEDALAGHSQGSTIRCLEEKIVGGSQVAEKCAKQIVRLSELSSSDFHLDRNLYFSCKEDRERFCESITSGEGRVYKCLFMHKFDRGMSKECLEALTLRQKLVSQDYKASYNLHTYCKDDIEKHACLDKPQYQSHGANDHEDMIGLSGVLLCLEDAKMDGESISDECDYNLNDFRRMLSEDYELSPEIVSGCKAEIAQGCNGGVRKGGETIHCLLGLAQGKNDDIALSKQCEAALMHLLKEDEAAYDYRMDHALAQACGPVVASTCKDMREGDPMVLSCLMENLYSGTMTSECQKRLLELQFFISRDFFLDPVFTKKCKKDAKRICNTELSNNENTMPYSLVVSCLFRHIPGKSEIELQASKETSDECTDEVYKIMANRALDVNLNPDLEHACLPQLGRFCSDQSVQKGSELQCLQDHFEEIKNPECIAQLEEVTQLEEEEEGNLDDKLMKACQPEVHRLCSAELDNGDEGLVMQCLIENKMDLNEACEAGVTHFQLIELKDVKFNYRFMKACKGDIEKECSELKKGVHTKLEVIECLSRANRDAILNEKESPISDDCRDQLTVENLQAHEDFRLDPELSEYCQKDYDQFCRKVKQGGARVISCLREHKSELSTECRKKLFGFEQEEVEAPELDYALMRGCKASIKKWCQVQAKSGDPDDLLDCLFHHKQKLDKGCREIVLERQQEAYSDINLHPELKKACMEDIISKCNKPLEEQEQDEANGSELHGRVIACLKEKETSTKKGDALSPQCSRHMQFVLEEEQNDYSLDPMLTLKCVGAIKRICKPSGRTNVIECLKQSYFEGRLKNDQECTVEVARLLKEGRFDIMADPILHNSCLEDIRVHCHSVPEGHGRIMACLLNVAKDDHLPVTSQCRDTLQQRKKMWSYAAEHGVQSLQDLGSAIFNSPHQSYLLTILTIFLLAVLILGVCCGRVTKRVSRQRKML